MTGSLPGTAGPAFTRRQLLAGGAALLGTAALAGCSGSAAAAGRTDLQFWHLLSGGDGIKMAGLIDTVVGDSDSYTVKPTVLAWGTPYYTKLAMASTGGRAPDVAIMHATRVAGYAPGGLLDPWDEDLLAKFGVDASTFPDRIWEKGFDGDKLFSVALDAHPFVMMINTDICDQAGVLDSDGRVDADSPEAFLDVLAAVQGVTGGHALSYGYLGDGAQMWRLFYTLYRQHDAEMDLSGAKAVVDDDAAVESFEFMQAFLDDTLAARQADYATAVAEFARGETGMLFTGVWELPTMQNADIPLDAQPIPTLFGTPAAYADSHAFVLPHQNTPNEAKRRETYKFVTDLLKNSLDWAEAGHIPAYLPITESAAYGDLLPQAHYAEAADVINYDPTAWFTGSGSNYQNYFAEYIQGVLLSGDDAAAGWRGFIDRTNTLLSKPNPVTAS